MGQADELQVSVRVGKQATAGEKVQLTAKASATKSLSYTDSAADTVSATAAPSPTTTTPAGGVTLPPVTLPPLTGTGVSPSDPSGLFPTVGPSPSPSTSSPLGLPPVKPHKTVRIADAAATVPLDSHLIGGQLVGLAVLIGAVVLAIARLSLRTPKPAEDKNAGKPPAS